MAEPFVIYNYSINYYSHRHKLPRMVIRLEDAEKKYFAELYFIESAKNLQSVILGNDGVSFVAYYSIKRYKEVVDLLRNEGPLSTAAFFHLNQPAYVGIHSEGEIVGEGE